MWTRCGELLASSRMYRQGSKKGCRRCRVSLKRPCRNTGAVDNCRAEGAVSSTGVNVGGLVGQNNDPVTNSRAAGEVNGTTLTGGLIGLNEGEFGDGTVNNCYATGVVIGTQSVGGLI